VDRTKEES